MGIGGGQQSQAVAIGLRMKSNGVLKGQVLSVVMPERLVALCPAALDAAAERTAGTTASFARELVQAGGGGCGAG